MGNDTEGRSAHRGRRSNDISLPRVIGSANRDLRDHLDYRRESHGYDLREKLNARWEIAREATLGHQSPNVADRASNKKRAATLMAPATGPGSRRKRRRNGQVPNDHPSPTPKQSFVPLNATPDRILSLHREKMGSPPPIKKDPAARDKSKQCEYHHDHGHATIECYQLRKQIDSLIRGGYLMEFIVSASKP